MHKSQICADLVNAVQTVMPGRVPTLTPLPPGTVANDSNGDAMTGVMTLIHMQMNLNY